MIYDFDTIYFDQMEETPIGTIRIAASKKDLIAVQIGGETGAFSQGLAAKFGVPVIYHKIGALNFLSKMGEYLYGERKSLDIPIPWAVMSSFQQKALQAVCAIPYGETRTYSQIAAEIGIPRAPRAVGRANATNPMPLVIPCHRVVGADGSLRGYGGGEGIKTKQWLLDLENGKK